MIILSVMYPRRDGARFDKTYYGNKHVPLVKDVFGPGLKGAQVMRGLSAADGSPACRRSVRRYRELHRHPAGDADQPAGRLDRACSPERRGRRGIEIVGRRVRAIGCTDAGAVTAA